MHKLRVKTSESAMVPDFAAFAGGVMRFVGRVHDPKAGTNGGWACTGEVVELPFTAEYRHEVQGGALIPQDEATARLCGVPFSPEQ